jgi:hypothetical protein
MATLEDYVTELVPVSEWAWWLYRVSYRDDYGNVLNLFLVSTDDQLDTEVEHHCPHDTCGSYIWAIMARASAPSQIWCPATLSEYPMSAQDAGERLARQLGFTSTTPVPAEFVVMD